MDDARKKEDITNRTTSNEAAHVQTSPRSKTSSRVHFTILTIGMLVLLLLGFISLGSFGKKQSEVSNFYSGVQRKCILYATYEGEKDGIVLIKLSSYGPCGFLIWGFVSVTIVAFSFIVYLVVLTVLGSKILSPLRILDFVVSLSTFVGSFILSITITAGLKQTCAITLQQRASCSASYLVRTNNIEDGEKLSFYNSIVVAQNSSWVATVLLFTFSVWNCILMVLYCIQRKKQKKEAKKEAVVI